MDTINKSNLYTGTGDMGMTSLVDGTRVSKCSLRLEAYGTLDEFSSFLGVVLSDSSCCEEERRHLLKVQNMLFNLGAYLATPTPAPSDIKEGAEPKAAFITDDVIREVELWIDGLDAATPKIRAFVLPGGCPLSASAHVARTVCRRAERRILELAAVEYVDPAVVRYVNRLSDWLFILARYFNHQAHVEEIIWKQ